MDYRTEPAGTLPDPSWTKLSDRQLVGTSHYCAVYRDLYETPGGERVSIRVSGEFETGLSAPGTSIPWLES